jgi:hypothetical protein
MSTQLCLISHEERCRLAHSPKQGDQVVEKTTPLVPANPPCPPFSKGGNAGLPLSQRGIRGGFLSVLLSSLQTVCRAEAPMECTCQGASQPVRGRSRT